MIEELAKVYEPGAIEGAAYGLWEERGAFGAEGSRVDGRKAYTIVIPPPNVTAALHLGHALNNTLQDILIRWRRMQGYEALWMPGTDHAGIATQTVVEKRILAEEGRRRTEFGREEFIQRVQAWKDQYEARIIGQLREMGCSCDWRRTRFTMDEVCARAVRAAFFQLFEDGLIYRGKRLVNWDPATQTVLADDEVEHETVHGYFYYMQYPLVEPVEVGGEQITHITVATTRPETMLGDTAVAMNPSDPRAAALVGKEVRLPIAGRIIKIIADEHVVLPDPESEDEKARMSTGFLKVTPAHDPNDWEIGQRHGLAVINVMGPDGSISDRHGWEDAGEDAQFLLGMDRFEARGAIVEWFRGEGLLEDVREYAHEVGHSYRSHVPIEPYLSDQWYIAVKRLIGRLAGEDRGQDARGTEDRGLEALGTKSEGAEDRGLEALGTKSEGTEDRGLEALGTKSEGTEDRGLEALGTMIEGTDVPVNSLAGLALTPLLDGRVRFVPERYGKTYQGWLENLRDWPISRQLWWGHRIPVWSKAGKHENRCEHGTFSRVVETEEGPVTFLCVRPGFEELEGAIEAEGWVRDPDVLDTWFSSSLWPFSTLGWPGAEEDVAAFYPGSVLCTAREIITLWVSRMVMMGQYCVGDIPFSDVFIHAMIQDGQGRKMSKSLGNGIDPADIIASHGADAMRFALAGMVTQTQDVRLPVEPVTLGDGRVVNSSPKFDLGRNFCNKLWNAARFAIGNLAEENPKSEALNSKQFSNDRNSNDRNEEGEEGGRGQDALGTQDRGLEALGTGEALAALRLEDRWILSRLHRTVGEVTGQLEGFAFSEPVGSLYRFFWNDFCDWYLEIVKPRMRDEVERGAAQRMVAYVLDATLRLMHPFVPFITEAIFQKLNEVCGRERGLAGVAELAGSDLLIRAAWPVADERLMDGAVEVEMELVQGVIRLVRDVRTRYQIGPRAGLKVSVKTDEVRARLLRGTEMVRQLGYIEELAAGPGVERPGDAAVAVTEEMEVYVHGVVDVEAERERLEKQRAELAGFVEKARAKLGNENFVTRAKAEVVERERERLGQLEEQLGTVEKNLAELKMKNEK